MTQQIGNKKGKYREFERMLSNELLKASACPVWERADYRFTFACSWENCEFLWQGVRLYVTSSEALHLYQRLVLGRKMSACTSRFALYGMRRKFGSAFLQEYLPTQTQMRREGRKSDLARELDGTYYKQELTKRRKKMSASTGGPKPDTILKETYSE
jgi:hypothetical protein